MQKENYHPVYVDELPDCHSRAERRHEWICPYEVDRRLFDFAETIFEPFMPQLKEVENKALYNVINNSQHGLWTYEYDNLSNTLYNSQNLPAILVNLAWILSGIGLLSLILLLLNLACRKAGYFTKSEKTETRPRLFFRACIYILLFTAILLGAIGYAGVVVDVNTQWILNSNLAVMDKEIQISKTGADQMSTRSFIQNEFHSVGEELEQRCEAAAARNGNGLKNLQIIVHRKWTKVHDTLGGLGRDMMIDKDGTTAALVDVVEDLSDYGKELSKAVKIWEFQDRDRVNKSQLNLIMDSQSKSLEESLGLVDQMERKLEKSKKRNEVILDWLTNVYAFVSNAHKRQLFVHFDYDFYQTPVAIIFSFGIAFLLIGYFATFYKFCYPTGKPEARRIEKWLGRLVYVGYVYFVLSTCYLSWNFMTIVRPTIAATSTCSAIADTKSFLPGQGQAQNEFYRLKEFQDFDGLPFNTKWQTGGRNAPLMGKMSFLDTLGQIMQQSDQLLPSLDFDNFAHAIFEWRNDIAKITKSCYELDVPLDKKYVDKLKISVGRLVQAMEGERPAKMDKMLYNFTEELASVQWDHSSYLAYQPTPTAEESSIENLWTKIVNEVNSNWKGARKNHKHLRRLFLMADGIICAQWSRPSVALLVTAVINTFLWVLCTVTMLSTARRWDLGETAAPSPLTVDDALGAPLIDKSKLDESLYDNPIAPI